MYIGEYEPRPMSQGSRRNELITYLHTDAYRAQTWPDYQSLQQVCALHTYHVCMYIPSDAIPLSKSVQRAPFRSLRQVTAHNASKVYVLFGGGVRLFSESAEVGTLYPAVTYQLAACHVLYRLQ